MILDFQNPLPGFYVEGSYAQNSPGPYDITFISGKKSRGYQPEKRLEMNVLVGEKFTSKLLISGDECRNFREINSETIEQLLSQNNLPDGFANWVSNKIFIKNHNLIK